MQPYRMTARTLPRVCKASPTPSRTMFTTPFFPHLNGELAPLFRMLDSAAADLIPTSRNQQALRQQQSFTPRFDVREKGQAYELQGELPGLEQKDLEIEFVDERTLVIRGRSAREETRNNSEEETTMNASGAVEAGDADAAAADTASERSANYRKASVEEEYVDAGADAEASASEAAAKTPTSTSAAEVARPETKKAQAVAEPAFSRYWVSERAVGEFERRFAFPGRVDQEAVNASLRNGILSVVVPKIGEKGARRIEIQS